jgi:hypothetical protein
MVNVTRVWMGKVGSPVVGVGVVRSVRVYDLAALLRRYSLPLALARQKMRVRLLWLGWLLLYYLFTCRPPRYATLLYSTAPPAPE